MTNENKTNEKANEGSPVLAWGVKNPEVDSFRYLRDYCEREGYAINQPRRDVVVIDKHDTKYRIEILPSEKDMTELNLHGVLGSCNSPETHEQFSYCELAELMERAKIYVNRDKAWNDLELRLRSIKCRKEDGQ